MNWITLNLVNVICLTLRSVEAIQWQNSESDQIRWSANCDFNGVDIGSQKGKGEDCGGACLSRQDCTRFTWTDYEGGTCWLKGGSGQAFDSQNNGVCGEKVGSTTVSDLKYLAW